MRIHTREKFLELPAGTLYTKGRPIAFQGLFVKGETLHNAEGKAVDWYCRDLTIIASEDTGDLLSKFNDMAENGASYPLEDIYGRDGCFDDSELFLVYEQADIDSMIDVFKAAREAAG